jgi:cephalosporin-C deacetylase-like acetyl esterase
MRLLLLSLMFLLPATVCGQDKKDKKPGDEMIEKYLAAETDKLTAKFLDGAKTIDEWKAKRPRLYQEYMDMLGLWPIPEKTPLKATKTGEVEAHGVVVEKVHFQSKPGLYVTANVYRPRDDAGATRKPLPAIVYVCGHSWKGRDGNKSAHQDHGFWYANNGYVCIILDTLQLGEIPGVHHGTYGTPWRHIGGYQSEGNIKYPANINENRFWWYDLGYSPAAVECWNGVRAIDYLCTRPDVDPARIGVTGISGGGAATFWIAAADERVKVAVPVSGMSDLQFYVKNKGVNSHCDCMFLYNTYQWDWTTIAALVAPRPLLFANSDKDPIFPMDANRRIMAKLQKLYAMYEKPQDNRSIPGGGPVEEYISPGDHAYRPDLRIAVFQFFNKHLKGDATTKVEDSAKYTPLKGRDLRVFPEDADLPKDALNGRIDETFIPAAKVTLPEKGKFAEWKKVMIAKLRATSFRPFPDKIPAGEMIENIKRMEVMSSEASIHAVTTGFGKVEKEPPTRLLYVADEDEWAWTAKSPEAAKKLLQSVFDKGGFLLWPRCPRFLDEDAFFSHLNWTMKSPPNYVARSHALLGRTIDQGRVRDIIATTKVWEEQIELYPKTPKDRWTLSGRGRGGILAAYAALFEPSIKEVIVIDPPKSHKEGPHLLNVLRVLDIPEALGLLAPTPLTIIGGLDPAFDRTAEIYRLAGAADKLKRK